MEKMPYRAELDVQTIPVPGIEAVVTTDWRAGLPVLAGKKVTLRELRPSDAESLFSLLTSQEVSRFISPPPSTVDGFRRFIAWTHRQRMEGSYVCFAVTLTGDDTAIGIFQVRELEPGFATAEWGFAIGSAFWGSGLFKEGAELVVSFAFEQIGVHRLEARACTQNGRGNGALRKLGAVREAVLRRSFLRRGEYLDQNLWTIIDEDWQAKKIWERQSSLIVH